MRHPLSRTACRCEEIAAWLLTRRIMRPPVTLLDPDIYIDTCPRCGQPLIYRGRARTYDVQIYDCAYDGRIVLRQDGSIGLATGVEQLYEVAPEALPRSPRTPVVFPRSMLCPFCQTTMLITEYSVSGTSYVCRACGHHDARPR
jgi:predicted RNA-binding Zn-ribbon protein involved in translation (DUF1610 family)